MAVHFRDGSLMRVYVTHRGFRRYFLSLDQIDPLLIKATLAFEDRRFFFHPGVDPLAILRAAWQDLKAGQVVSGGSTLTQQMVRLLRPGPRTLWRKLLEAYRALELEAHHSKKEILELYFNLAPYGGNLEGVGAASLAYFGKPPRFLTPDEVAFLISLPQAPIRGKKKDLAARNRILKRMTAAALITSQDEQRARKAPLPSRRIPFPFEAPHAADYLRRMLPGKAHIVSTLDPVLQAQTEEIVRQHEEALLATGITAAAVVVIRNSDRAVKALVGSLNYWDTEFHGQIRGFAIPRSSGSTLKPFLYALALQRGRITPETKLEDRPRAFGSFRPVDFTPRFRGLVPAQTALALSLNLPFVNLLKTLGLKPFLTLMKQAGFRWRRPPGLSAITGGLDVSLLDLTNFYVTLAREGYHGPPRFLVHAPLKERPLFHPGVAYLTLQALKSENHGLPWPDFDLAWKTGTSFGQRDAWAIGISPQYTVGVWTGNFNGQGARGLIGATAALPILLDIMKALGSKPARFPSAAEHLIWIKLCPASGRPAGPFCPQTIRVPYPKGIPLPARCRWHRPFLMVRGTNYRACPWKTYPEGSLERRILCVPSGRAAPPFPPSCEVENSPGDVRILSPAAGALYLLSRNGTISRGIPLKGYTNLPDGNLYWFVNGKLSGTSLSGEAIYLSPPAGKVEIRVVDKQGHWSRVVSWIEYISPGHSSHPDREKISTSPPAKSLFRKQPSEGQYEPRQSPRRSAALPG